MVVYQGKLYKKVFDHRDNGWLSKKVVLDLISGKAITLVNMKEVTSATRERVIASVTLAGTTTNVIPGKASTSLSSGKPLAYASLSEVEFPANIKETINLGWKTKIY